MPLIQVDVKKGLSAERKRVLTDRIREDVNAALGSPDPYISIVIRESDPSGLVESGTPKPGEA